MRCDCKGGDVPHTGAAVHKRTHGRCTRTATAALRRTDRGKGVVSPWYEYCEPCAAAIEAYQGSTVERRAVEVHVKLSDAQAHALGQVSNENPLTSFRATLLGLRRKTLVALGERGLIVYQPYADKGGGAYNLTPEGRAAVVALLASGALVKE